MPKIYVSGNCQVGGVAASIEKLINRKLEVKPFDSRNIKEIDLKNTDFLISMSTGGIPDYFQEFTGKKIMLPIINFDAFHPDICYLNHGETRIEPHYNSKIIAQCFMKGYPEDKVVQFFNEDIFQRLGYFDRYKNSKLNIRNTFSSLNYNESNFLRFFQKIQREGLFMYSINHPKVFVLTEISKIALEKLLPGYVLDLQNLYIPDALQNGAIWPCYPEIAKTYSLNGDYYFKFGENILPSLEEYIQFSYEKYKKAELDFGATSFADLTEDEIDLISSVISI